MKLRHPISMFSFSALLLLAAATAPADPFWQRTAGPGGGQISDLARTAAGTLFALSDQLYRSNDAGYSWHAMDPPSTGAGPLFTTPDGRLYVSGATGIAMTSNEGVSWNTNSEAPPRAQLYAATNGRLFAANSSGLWVSHDQGITWAASFTSSVRGFVEASDGSLYLGTWGTPLYRSTDGGSEWTRIATVPGNIWHLAVRPQGGIWVCTEAYEWSGAGGGLFVWNGAEIAGPQFHETISDIVVRDDGRIYIACWGVCQPFGCYGGGVYSSTDGGDSWHLAGLPGYAITALVAAPGGGLFAGTTGMFVDYGNTPGAGIWRTSGPCTVWAPVNRGLASAASFSVASAGGVVYATGDAAFHWSADHGTTWNVGTPCTPWAGRPTTPGLAAHPNGAVFAYEEGVLRSRDRGATWEPLALSGYGRVRLTISPAGTILVANGETSLQVSADGGDHFSPVPSGIAQPIEVVRSGPVRRVFSASRNTILLSEDDGATWGPIGSRTTPDWDSNVLGVGWDESSVWFTDQQGLRRLVEHSPGVWSEETPPQPPGRLQDLVFDSQGVAYASYGGTASLRPGAAAWEPLEDYPAVGFQPWNPHTFAFDARGYLYAGTSASGVVRSRMPIASPTDVHPAFGPSVAAVPNPFRSRASFSFGLQRESHVRLVLYDVRGRVVTSLADHRLPAGASTLVWEPSSDVPRGVYFYELQAGSIRRRGHLTYLR